MRSYIPRGMTSTLALALGLLTAQGSAQADTFAGLAPVPSQTLAHVRGGFSMSFDFGQMGITLDMSQMSFINGQLVPVQQIMDASGGTVNLVQNGRGDAAALTSSPDKVGGAINSSVPITGAGSIGLSGLVGSGGSMVPGILVQTGLGSGATASLVNDIPTTMLGTVIQNSLDGQVIQNLNVLNVTVTSQALAQTMALQAMTQGALLRFLH